MAIQEALRYPTMMAYATAIAARGVSGPTLCRRIEQAVEAGCVGLDRSKKRARVVESVREGLFLMYLFRACNADFAQTARERDLEAMLLRSLMWMYAHDEGDAGAGLESWLEVARRFVEDEQARLEAVDLIAERYFDGAQILYPQVRARARTASRRVEELILVVDGAAKRGSGRVKSRSDSDGTSPRVIAQGWVDLARAQVHWELDEESRAFEACARVLGGTPNAAVDEMD